MGQFGGQRDPPRRKRDTNSRTRPFGTLEVDSLQTLNPDFASSVGKAVAWLHRQKHSASAPLPTAVSRQSSPLHSGVGRSPMPNTGSARRASRCSKKGKTDQSACKPGSVQRSEDRAATIPLGRRSHGASSNPPERLARRQAGGKPPRRSYSVLLPVGFTMPLPLPVARWALTPPFHPDPEPDGSGRGGLFSVALSLGSPPPGVTRHRVSVEPGLSSPAAFRHLRQRSPGRLIRAGCRPRRGASQPAVDTSTLARNTYSEARTTLTFSQ